MLGIEKGADKGEANNEKKTIYNLFHNCIYSFVKKTYGSQQVYLRQNTLLINASNYFNQLFLNYLSNKTRK